MGRIKTVPGDMVRIEIHPVNKGQSPPHITAFVNKWGTDHRGDMTGMGDLQACKSKREVLAELGRIVLESSENVRNWMRDNNID